MKPVSPVIPGENMDEIKVAEHQPEYQTLPTLQFAGGNILSRWSMDEAERRVVETTGELYICLMTFGDDPPDTIFQVDNPLVSESEALNLKEKTAYFGASLPVIHRDDQCVWMLLQLTEADRVTVALEGNVYFFMNTKGRPVTPSMIQVEKPFVTDEIEYMVGIRAGEKANAVAAQFKIEFAEYFCCVCNHKTVVSKQIVPRIEDNDLKIICKICVEGSGMQICVMPETVDEYRQALEIHNSRN